MDSADKKAFSRFVAVRRSQTFRMTQLDSIVSDGRPSAYGRAALQKLAMRQELQRRRYIQVFEKIPLRDFERQDYILRPGPRLRECDATPYCPRDRHSAKLA